jgi:hypothetical protein
LYISFNKIVGNFTKMPRVIKDIVADIKILIILSTHRLFMEREGVGWTFPTQEEENQEGTQDCIGLK